MSWLLDLWRSCFGTPEVPEPTDLVTIWVDGAQHQVTPGPGYGRRLRGEIALQDGMMLLQTSHGVYVGEKDLIDLQGGETFSTFRAGGYGAF